MFKTPDNNSEPNLSTIGITDTPTNYVSKSRALKRFRSSSGDISFRDEFLGFKDDIKQMFIKLQTDTMNEIRAQFASFKVDTDARLTKIEDSLMLIEKSNQEIDKSISFTTQQYDDMKLKSDRLERECKEHRALLLSLEDKIEEMQRISNINFLEMRNLPRKQGETRSDLDRCMGNLFKTINASVSVSGIRDVFRLPSKKDSHPSILIEFGNNASKNTVLRAVKAYNQSKNQVQLNGADLGAGVSSPVYISEYLTPNARKLHFISRKHVKNNQLKYCWTSNGKILVKKGELEPTIHIKTEEQLVKLIDTKI